jgi:VRR-NUC domain
MSLSIAKKPEDWSEQEWDGVLFRGDKAVAAMLGWRLRYHTLRSKGSQSGFPDRVLVRDRVVYVETKSEKGKPSDAQIDWLDGLTKAGSECYLWRPSDWDEAGRVLSKRWVFLPRPSEGGRLHMGEEFWIPGSLWVAGVGRYDETSPEPEVPGQTSIDDFVS